MTRKEKYIQTQQKKGRIRWELKEIYLDNRYKTNNHFLANQARREAIREMIKQAPYDKQLILDAIIKKK